MDQPESPMWVQRRSHGAGTEANATTPFNSASGDSHYQRDRARVIHSASFRALQSKTQVLGLGESDFYRTRLTHSLEVAQIGSGICDWLCEQPDPDDYHRWIPSFSLIESICLAHDIGHAPFGHGGEVAMNARMHAHGGFEGNGQTLRILARLGEFSADYGLDLCRRTMLGTLKYPALHSDVAQYSANSTAADDNDLNIDGWTPPKCIYDSESDVLEWLLEPFSESDRRTFLTLEARPGRHSRSLFKPFDTSIMELADDIAYGIHDLEDALTLGLVDREHWMAHVSTVIARYDDNPVTQKLDEINNGLFSQAAHERKHAVSRLVRYLITSVVIERQEPFDSPLLALQVTLPSPARDLLDLIKDYVMRHVIFRPELQHLQYKGQRVMVRLFDIFAANPERLLPRAVYARFDGDEGYRALSDYLASMTDVSAGKLYHKLLSPSAGSIYDRP